MRLRGPDTGKAQRSTPFITGASLLVLLCALLTPKARAEDEFTAGTRILKIRGNERTHGEYVEKMVDDCLLHAAFPQQPGYLDAYLKQCLLNTKLFSDVKVKITPRLLDIEVKERWTLIPIPYLQVGTGNSRKVGMIVAETNFLGKGKVLVAGAFVSNVGATYAAYFQDPSINYTDWRADVLVDQNSEELRLFERRAVVDTFTESASGALAGIGYKLNQLIINTHLGYRQRFYTLVDDYIPPYSQKFGYVNFIGEYSNKDFHFYGSNGFSLKVNSTNQFARTDHLEPADNIDYVLSYEHLIWEEALQVQATGGSVHGGAREDAYRLGGQKGFRGIETHGLWADHYEALSLDYQIPIKYLSTGTWTVGPFNDVGMIRARGGHDYVTRYDSYGIATYFYLTTIALPGIGIEFGVNNQFQGPFANLTIGFSL